jgi:hypothetical protein
MAQRELRTWNEFLLDFDDYARAHLQSPFPSTSHQPLLRLAIMQRMVGAVQRELFKLQEVFYKPDPRLLSQPPNWVPPADGLHDHFELHFPEVLKECNCVALAVTSYPANGVAEWSHILRQILTQLARPKRVIYVLLSNCDSMVTSQYTVADIYIREQHIEASRPRLTILASATADSVLTAGKNFLDDRFLNFLQDQADFDRERLRLMDGTFAPLQARYSALLLETVQEEHAASD